MARSVSAGLALAAAKGGDGTTGTCSPRQRDASSHLLRVHERPQGRRVTDRKSGKQKRSGHFRQNTKCRVRFGRVSLSRHSIKAVRAATVFRFSRGAGPLPFTLIQLREVGNYEPARVSFALDQRVARPNMPTSCPAGGRLLAIFLT